MAEEVEGQGRREHFDDYLRRDDDLPGRDILGFEDPGGHSDTRDPFPRPSGDADADDPAGEPGKEDPFPRPKKIEYIYEEQEGVESDQG